MSANAHLHAWRTPSSPWRSRPPRPRRGTEAIMNDAAPAYGLWSLVIVNSAIFILFAYTFFKPQTPRDWRSFGAFSAFL
ncbi:MAG: isoprenylcysteine carboxylmethyltransferase family protein, partial [Bradyrhizobium sp.]|nr:isoprenylcysteine carboxylmethyltransferase family protein [Bradyrhizobium sp.]